MCDSFKYVNYYICSMYTCVFLNLMVFICNFTENISSTE